MSRSIIYGTLVLGMQEGITCLASFAAHCFAGRSLGPELYGLLSLVLAILSILNFSFLLGIPYAVSKYTAENINCSSDLLTKGLKLQTVLASGLAILLFCGSERIGAILDNSAIVYLIRIASLSLPFTGISYILIYSLNGQRKFKGQAIALGALTVFKMAAIVIFIAAGFDLSGVVFAIVISAVATCLLSSFLLGTASTKQFFSTKKLIKCSIQMSMTYILINLWYYLDPLLLDLFGSDIHDIGLFKSASTLTYVPESFFLPVLIALFPNIAKLASRGEIEKVKASISKLLFYSIVIMCPVIVGASLIAQDLLIIFFGTEYISASTIIAPLTLTALLRIMYILIDTYLRASGNTSLSILIAAITLAVHIVSCSLVIPLYHLNGLVIAIIISASLSFILAGTYFKNKFDVHIDWTSIVKIVFCSAVAFIPLLFINSQGITTILATLPCLLLYFMLIILNKIVPKDDFDNLKNSMKRMKSYSEI